ncbi:MAG TPA: FGGY family carbohydrate kinase [Chitinophagaceae bacterium]|nr:FGGY family carbohydrate kinase [Chitinophagaceae bacterium]
MNKIPVIAIFDVGKTNKKLLLFNEQYELIQEDSRPMDEITDEDGFPCDDVQALTSWIRDTYSRLLSSEQFEVKGINFSGYGASFVYIGADGRVMLPLYNYLKPYPKPLLEKFYTKYGGEDIVASQTASPVLGSLNSGMQVYRLKEERPDVFENIIAALHLPQYLSYVLTGALHTDITSIGCHTNLWDFTQQHYHHWVTEENIGEKFPAITACTALAGYTKEGVPVGTGLHDSSAALIPYLASFTEPFVLLSTGTWCITLNPFNPHPLTLDELKSDCLCYLSYKGKPVKASRLFAGNEHEQQVKRLSAHYQQEADYYKTIHADPLLLKKYLPDFDGLKNDLEGYLPAESVFADRDLADFASYEEAYHLLIADLMALQVQSSWLVMKDTAVQKIFVDGGFSKNPIYMQLLSAAFPDKEVYAATVAQASSLGAAMAIHSLWNKQPLPSSLVQLRKYGQ